MSNQEQQRIGSPILAIQNNQAHYSIDDEGAPDHVGQLGLNDDFGLSGAYYDKDGNVIGDQSKLKQTVRLS